MSAGQTAAHEGAISFADGAFRCRLTIMAAKLERPQRLPKTRSVRPAGGKQAVAECARAEGDQQAHHRQRKYAIPFAAVA
jgi:hypothetical protein